MTKVSHKTIQQCQEVETPALVFDESIINELCGILSEIKAECNCKVLYSVKAFSAEWYLGKLTSRLDGFSVSSAFEAQLAKRHATPISHSHFSSPGLRKADIPVINECCTALSFNSFSQFERFGSFLKKINKGIRVNPQISFVKDPRYNPCREYSKLGIPIDTILSTECYSPDITGLHFHTNCESQSVDPLSKTVEILEEKAPKLLHNIRWINLGGGYQYDEIVNLDPLKKTVQILQKKYGLDVFLEPGEALVKNAAFLVATVIDIIHAPEKSIAILDTTINHIPQVFEYQYEPDILGWDQYGKHEYLLAGCSCLAGDLFGEYTFNEPLAVGKRLIFTGMGSYTFVKANMFNGICFPKIYFVDVNGKLSKLREFVLNDYLNLWRNG
jgi:carboxynorspermidine decarboxylase